MNKNSCKYSMSSALLLPYLGYTGRRKYTKRLGSVRGWKTSIGYSEEIHNFRLGAVDGKKLVAGSLLAGFK